MDLDGVSVYRKFLYLHKPQLELSGIPQHFWEVLYKKLTNQIFDAGDAFSLLLIDYGDEQRDAEDPVWTLAVSKDAGINANDPREIYIVDHAWTFRMDMARNQLQQVPELLQRMCRIMGINENGTEAEEPNNQGNNDERIEQVLKSLWQYCQMYSINSNEVSVEDRMPIWYVMDELGSAVNHNDSPNFRIVPFMLLPEQTTYSLLFPIKDCPDGTYVCRNYVENYPETSPLRQALLLPWKYTDFTNVDYKQCEPDVEYFREGRIEESFPIERANNGNDENDSGNRLPLKVFTEYPLIRQYLTDASSFVVVDDRNEADILWLTHHFKTFQELSVDSPHKFINQFPCENVITVKDLLSIVCRRKSPETPAWLPITYNLRTELLKFVSYFQNCEQQQLDNHWIIKPWNLARGLDMYITKDLAQIMRLQPTGPKIAQKYIHEPVLFHRSDVNGKVKFDVRYVVLLSSTHPLRAHIYKNFFLRFANKPFELNRFDDYQQHFTVMNYANEYQLRHIPCAEFLDLWHEQYPMQSWTDIEKNICEMLRDVFECAVMNEPPSGIGHSRQSRAMYAVDLMLAWENGLIQPKILEMNWTPDCQRACEYYPNFFNDIFKMLFFDDDSSEMFYTFTNK